MGTLKILPLCNVHNRTGKYRRNFGLGGIHPLRGEVCPLAADRRRGQKKKGKEHFQAFGGAKPRFTGDFPEKKEKSFEFLRNSSCQMGQWVV